jgi:hypothetical protein
LRASLIIISRRPASPQCCSPSSSWINFRRV